MKRMIATFLFLTMILAVIISGCGQRIDEAELNKVEGFPYVEGEQVQFPLEESVTLTALVVTRPNLDDYENNAFTKYLEERTNINLEFIVVEAGRAAEEISLILSTGDYPDIVMGVQLNPTLQALYGEQGILIPLNDMIEIYGEQTKKVFDEYPMAYKSVSMNNGHIYNLPKISHCYHCMSTQKLWIYEPWLDQLGLAMPTTTEEFRQVLKAFATQDPNGNGKSDEIPFSGAINGWNTQVEAHLMNSFVYTANSSMSGTSKLYIEDGIVKASYVQNEWKDGLKYLQSLSREGLIARESFTQAEDGLRSMGENLDEVILGVFGGGSVTTGTSLLGDRWHQYTTIPPLEGPDGVRYAHYDPYRSIAPGLSITNKCQYPEIAFALADLMYEEEVSLNNAIGPQGLAWDYIDDENKKGIDGQKATWELLQPFVKQEKNISWQQVGNAYRPSELRLGRYEDDQANIETVLYRETKNNYVPYYPDVAMSIPHLVFTDEQSAELLNITGAINSYVEEKLAEYVVTDIDIDMDFPIYLEALDDMGLQKMLEIYQEVYDNYNKLD